MLKLIVYPKGESQKLINNSPFCSKSEILLRLAGIDHQIEEFNGNPGKFPKAKLPVLDHDGKVIADSSFIQKYLESHFSVNLDAHLSDSEKAQGFAFAKMAEEYLYWCVLYERWLIDENWIKLRDGYFTNIPKLIRGPITGMIRGGVKKATIGHGMGRHSVEEIFECGREALQAVSNFLADKDYLLGSQVSSYDTTIYAFVASVLHSPLGPELEAEAKKYQNLVAYDKRMFELVFQG